MKYHYSRLTPVQKVIYDDVLAKSGDHIAAFCLTEEIIADLITVKRTLDASIKSKKPQLSELQQQEEKC